MAERSNTSAGPRSLFPARYGLARVPTLLISSLAVASVTTTAYAQASREAGLRLQLGGRTVELGRRADLLERSSGAQLSTAPGLSLVVARDIPVTCKATRNDDGIRVMERQHDTGFFKVPEFVPVHDLRRAVILEATFEPPPSKPVTPALYEGRHRHVVNFVECDDDKLWLVLPSLKLASVRFKEANASASGGLLIEREGVVVAAEIGQRRKLGTSEVTVSEASEILESSCRIEGLQGLTLGPDEDAGIYLGREGRPLSEVTRRWVKVEWPAGTRAPDRFGLRTDDGDHYGEVVAAVCHRVAYVGLPTKVLEPRTLQVKLLKARPGRGLRLGFSGTEVAVGYRKELLAAEPGESVAVARTADGLLWEVTSAKAKEDCGGSRGNLSGMRNDERAVALRVRSLSGHRVSIKLDAANASKAVFYEECSDGTARLVLPVLPLKRVNLATWVGRREEFSKVDLLIEWPGDAEKVVPLWTTFSKPALKSVSVGAGKATAVAVDRMEPGCRPQRVKGLEWAQGAEGQLLYRVGAAYDDMEAHRRAWVRIEWPKGVKPPTKLELRAQAQDANDFLAFVVCEDQAYAGVLLSPTTRQSTTTAGTAGWVFVSVGLAGGLGAGVSYLLAGGFQDKADKATTVAELEDAISQTRTAEDVATYMAIAAGALLALGIVFHIFDPGSDPPGLAVSAGPDNFGAAAVVRW